MIKGELAPVLERLADALADTRGGGDGCSRTLLEPLDVFDTKPKPAFVINASSRVRRRREFPAALRNAARIKSFYYYYSRRGLFYSKEYPPFVVWSFYE